MQTIAKSPVRNMLEKLLNFGRWIGTSAPSIFFFGEYEYPKEADYIH